LAITALQQLMDLQRSMYDRAISDARENIGHGNASILKYQREFESSLPNHFTRVNANKILEAIDRNPIILFGDFHSHKQSQRAFLRILRMYQNRPDHAPVIVGLEMFRSKDQKYLDKWMEGSITDQELLDAVEYERTWGFPWANFRPILEYCKYNAIRAVGLNTNNGGKDSLKKRDAHAANLLNEIVKSDPRARIFCLIGEFHLADPHLPQAIENVPRNASQPPLRIFANLDKFFFAIKHDKIHHKDEYLSLNKNTFCVINSPPWMKWHSHSLWEEMRRVGSVKFLEEAIAPDDVESDLDSEGDDAYTDEVLDLDYHLRHLQKQVCSFFKLPLSSEQFERFHVSHDNLDSELRDMSSSSRDAFLTRVSLDGFAVDYQHRLVYVPEVTINNLAGAAGQMLFGARTQICEDSTSPEQIFAVQCLKYAFGFIANKILNPRIPLHDRRTLEAYIVSSRGKRLIGQMRQRRHLAKSTLAAQAWIEKNWLHSKTSRRSLRPLPKRFIMLDMSTAHELSRSLAQVIAAPVCNGLVKGKLDTADVAKWLTQDWTDPDTIKKTIASMMTLAL